MLALVGVGAVGLAGCGSGSVQSPDFTPQLRALSLTSDAETGPVGVADYQVPVGARASLDVQGTFSLPPGSGSDTETRPTDADFSITPADGAARIENGELVAVNQGGVVTVVARRDDPLSGDMIQSDPVTFVIVAPKLVSIAIDPSAAQTISTFQTQTYRVLGTFTDTTADNPPRPVNVTWEEVPLSGDPVVTLSNPDNPSGAVSPATRTRATPRMGKAGQSTQIRATSVDGQALTSTVTLNINTTVLSSLDSVTCTPDVIAVGAQATCVAQGTFTDSSSGQTSTGALPNELLTWDTPSDNNASVDANGVATGLVAGSQSRVVATISSPITGSAGDDLTITDARCTGPFLSATAGTVLTPPSSVSSVGNSGAGTPFSATCLLCNIDNPGSVIDGDINTFGTLGITLGLLNPTATLSVRGTASYPSGTPAGFVVAQPAGPLLSAELLSTVTVTTLDSAGNAVEFASVGAGGGSPFPLPPLPLNVTLLGTLGGKEAALISFTPTQAFNGLALTFDGGVLSALPAINVFQACATANPAATP